MTVYFLQVGNNGPVKIGCSERATAWDRFDSIQTGHYEPLRMLAILEGGRTMEKALHALFRPYRMRGEWFKPDGDFKKVLRFLPPCPGRKDEVTHMIAIEGEKIVLKPINAKQKRTK